MAEPDPEIGGSCLGGVGFVVLFVGGPCIGGLIAHAAVQLLDVEFASRSTERQIVGAVAALVFTALVAVHHLLIRRAWGPD